MAAVSAAEALQEIAAIVEAERARHPVPGLAVGLAIGDETHTAAFGVTSVDHPLPVTPDTLFQIGSITKTFLGTLVMRLVEERQLDLDTPVRRWVPELRLRDADAAAGVTLRHCLTHMCGWFGDHFEDFGNSDGALSRYVTSMAELEQQVPLGSVWAYNNAAFCLAGRVVEVVTGETIETAMRERLFVPLRLQRTFFFAHEVITHRVASGHNVFDGEPRVARPWAIPRAQNAAGGIVASVEDLLRYARFHMGDGTAEGGYRYLSAESLEHMRSPHVAGALGVMRGIAWSVEDVGGVRVIGHNGATIGQQALLQIAPQMRLALAMLTNSSEATQLQLAMNRWWAERQVGVTRSRPAPMEATNEQLEPLVGTYRNPATELRIALEDGGLVVHRSLFGSLRKVMEDPPPQPKPEHAALSAADRIILLEGPLAGSQIELLGDARPVEWIRFSSRLYRKIA